jgi:hypothetical protein
VDLESTSKRFVNEAFNCLLRFTRYEVYSGQSLQVRGKDYVMRRVLAFYLLVVSSLFGCAFGQQSNPRLDAVKKYILEKDYPEVFGTDHYKTRIEGVLDVDVDNDGSKEVVILYYPHYRRSAPIVIYKITPDLKVTRVTEGLAPGPLQKVSGDYLDSHNLGSAADIEIEGKNPLESVLQVIAKSGMGGLVAYDSFFHMDGRTGFLSFIDMRGVKLPSAKHDCELFEFSRVKQIAAGHLREDPTNNYLAAWVGDEIYVYLIRGISNEGMLNKQLSVVKAPQGFKGFETNQGLTYKTDSSTAILTLK